MFCKISSLWTISPTMTQEIVCQRAVPADPYEVQENLVSYKGICSNLLERTKKFDANSPNLTSEDFNVFLESSCGQSLKIIRGIECLIQPYIHDWIAIPQSAEQQLSKLCLDLTRLHSGLCLVESLSELTVHASTDTQATVCIYLRMTRRVIMRSSEVAFEKSRQQINRFTQDDSSSCGSAAGSATAPEDWSEVSSQTSSLSARSGMADCNIAYCEGLVVGFLDSLHAKQPETTPLHSKDSPGRLLLRGACKLLMKEHTGYTGIVDEPHSVDDKVPDRSQIETLHYLSSAGRLLMSFKASGVCSFMVDMAEGSHI
ncbi:hypothetical protein KCU65_g234, partial [Aureobasidium melanogenum]